MAARASSPRTLAAVIGLLASAAAFATLGRWQLDRAATSREAAERFAAAPAHAPLETPLEDATAAEHRFRRLSVRGAYEPEQQFLLDNIVHEGQVGYLVLTPFKPYDDDRLLLVNRGWLPAAPHRGVLPDVGVPAGERMVGGVVDRLPRAGLRLGADASPTTRDGVAVVSYPTAAELTASLARPVHDYQLLLDAAEPDGYVREWSAPGLGPERHIIYAGQWLLLAVGAAGAAVVIAWKHVRSRA